MIPLYKPQYFNTYFFKFINDIKFPKVEWEDWLFV